MAFNGFPYVNFADLNLDWLLSRIQDVLTLVNSANEQSDNAIELATSANERTLTYAQQIADATADAEEALGLAQDSQDILVIYPDNEGKPVNYKKYMNGETEYIGTDEILTELTLHKRIPFFMDRSQNIFVLNGAIDSGTANTKIRFYRVEDGVFTFAVIDRNQTITNSYSDSGFVPLSSIDDSGKVLTVGSNGAPSWVTPSGGGGTAVQEIVWGYQDEDSGRAVIRKRSDNTIYTAAQMETDATARKLILIQSVNGIYYLSGAGAIYGQFSIASFFNGGTYKMAVDNNGVFSEIPVITVPSYDTNNAGNFLRVNSGGTGIAWESVPNAESNSFGGVS